MNISKLGLSIAESTTLKLNETFGILKSQGEAVIHLGGGEPFGKAPDEAIVLTSELLQTGVVRYSPSAGTKELREAVCNYTENFYGVKPGITNVIISTGAKQALLVALQAIVNPCEKVLFAAPYWVSYPEMVKLASGVPSYFIPSSQDFIPTIEEFEKNITGDTRAILVNSPNNPTGVMYPEKLIKDLVELTRRKGIYLIMDDIYHRLVFDGKKHPSVLKYVENLDNSHVILINGISKTYAMTGFRIGWAVAAPQLIKVMVNIQSHQTGGPSPLLQKAALGAITGNQKGVDELRNTLEANRNLMVELLSKLKGVNITVPDGTFYMYVDFSGIEPDSMKLSAFLLEKVKVLTMPGKAFGLDGHLRPSYCGSAEDIKEGINRIVWALGNSTESINIGGKTIKKTDL
jgi:aspartate aminotransferase